MCKGSTILPAGNGPSRDMDSNLRFTRRAHIWGSMVQYILPRGGRATRYEEGGGSGNSVDGRSSHCFFSLGRVEPVRNGLVASMQPTTRALQALTGLSSIPSARQVGDTISRRCTADERPSFTLRPMCRWRCSLAGRALYNRKA